MHLGPAVADYCQQHPNVQVSMGLTDRFVDIVSEGVDVVVRIAELEDSSLIARKVAPCRRALCASPEYLKRYGTPKVPQDLAIHRCLFYTNLPTANAWVLNGPNGVETGRVNGPIRAGRLQVVLPEYCPPEIAIYAVYPSKRYLSAKVRTFVDFLPGYFGQSSEWDRFPGSKRDYFLDQATHKQ